LERAAVAAALESFDGVLALGRRAVLAEPTRALLRDHRVVYLSVELLRRRSAGSGWGSGRPLLTVNPRATLKFLLEQAAARLYLEVATITVVDRRPQARRRSPDEILRALLTRVPSVPVRLPTVDACDRTDGMS
jgi:shikimate kinase